MKKIVLLLSLSSMFASVSHANALDKVVAIQQAEVGSLRKSVQELSQRRIVVFAEGGYGLQIPGTSRAQNWSAHLAGLEQSSLIDPSGTIANARDRLTFKAPRDGIYEFNVRTQISTTIPVANTLFDIILANSDGSHRLWLASERLWQGWTHSVVKDSRFVKLAKGEKVDIKIGTTQDLALHNWIVQIKSVD